MNGLYLFIFSAYSYGVGTSCRKVFGAGNKVLSSLQIPSAHCSGQSGRARGARPTVQPPPSPPWHPLGRSGRWSWPSPSLSWMSRRVPHPGESAGPRVTSSSCRGVHPWMVDGRAPPHACHVRSHKTDERLKKPCRFHSRKAQSPPSV